MSRDGRPSKYNEEMCDKLLEYFNVEPYETKYEIYTYKDGTTKEKEYEVANDLPTVQGFCKTIGIHRDTFYEWCKVHEEFSDTFKKCKEMMEYNWQVCSLKGLYSNAYTIFFGKNVFKYTDKQELETTNVNVDVDDFGSVEEAKEFLKKLGVKHE